MANPFIGEIRMFGGTFAPVGWALCEGQLMAITENEALYSLIGTTYGGDGQSTFALPDLRSRVPVHQGPGFNIGQSGGEETVTVSVAQLPNHSHVPQAANAIGTAPDPAHGVWAEMSGVNAYNTMTPNASMDPAAIRSAGGSQPHDNMVPFLAVNFIISLFGIFPTKN